MKKLIFTLFMAVAAVATYGQSVNDTLSVFIDDSSPTNVRSAPGGSVVLQMPSNCSYIATVCSPRNGWWRLIVADNAEEGGEVSLVGSPSKQYWVHSSVLGLSSRNYGGERFVLRAEPNDKAKAVYTFTDEITFIPIDAKDDWVKVSTADGKHTGWIEVEQLCANPLTNCC